MLVLSEYDYLGVFTFGIVSRKLRSI